MTVARTTGLPREPRPQLDVSRAAPIERERRERRT
jgi:hypothetical protein